jgi:hypothetical protein
VGKRCRAYGYRCYRAAARIGGLGGSTSKPECGALVCPNAGNTLKQPLDGQGSGLATVDNGLDDVGRQIAEPQDPADMGVAQSEASGDIHRVRIFSAAKVSHP